MKETVSFKKKCVRTNESIECFNKTVKSRLFSIAQIKKISFSFQESIIITVTHTTPLIIIWLRFSLLL